MSAQGAAPASCDPLVNDSGCDGGCYGIGVCRRSIIVTFNISDFRRGGAQIESLGLTQHLSAPQGRPGLQTPELAGRSGRDRAHRVRQTGRGRRLRPAGKLYREVLSATDRDHLVTNIVGHLKLRRETRDAAARDPILEQGRCNFRCANPHRTRGKSCRT
jgi:hypothetical protein